MSKVPEDERKLRRMREERNTCLGYSEGDGYEWAIFLVFY